MSQNKFTTNNNPTLVAVSADDGETPVYLYADPITHALVGSGGNSSPITYESRNDTTTDTNLVYLGKALPGSDVTDAAWQIKRYNKSAGTMTFADDATTFTKIWDNRTGYTY